MGKRQKKGRPGRATRTVAGRDSSRLIQAIHAIAILAFEAGDQEGLAATAWRMRRMTS